MNCRRALTAVASVILTASMCCAEPTLKALIVDGQNNHDWKATTPLLRKHLEGTRLFQVDVATSPPKGGDMESFRPEFANYDAVVINYNGQEWSEDAKAALVKYVRGGGGLVIVHAANNPFPGWPEYNEMIGLGWRQKDFGERLAFDDSGTVVRLPAGEGPNSNHGPQHEFIVKIRDAQHPIVKDLPLQWRHAKDELYQGQRGPAQNMQILATAYSAPEFKGTGLHEPMMWVVPYGKGRVFTTVLGHSADPAMRCVGFATTLQRGAEWAATAKVTQDKLPADFPTAEKVGLATAK